MPVSTPKGIALDTDGNIYVANFTGNNGSISVFAPGSNGNASPIASIAGANTGLDGPDGVTLDSAATSIFQIEQVASPFIRAVRTAM